MSEIVIGATIVSLGTTLPEVLVSTTAGLKGCADIAVGNAFGSIICNAAFVAGLSQFFRPCTEIDRRAFGWRVFFFFASASVVFSFGYGSGYFGLMAGLILLGLFVVYAYLNMAPSRIDSDMAGELETEDVKLWRPITMLTITAAMLFAGAQLLVDNGISIAEALGVPERVIGVTFIALGTSLPELVTAITSLIKGHGAVSIGNILGANILNILLVIGIPSVLSGITPSAAALRLDLPVAVGVMAVLTLPMLITKRGTRLQGLILLVAYFAYCIYQF